MPGGFFLTGDILGWIAWTFLAIPGLILIWASVVEAINDLRWRRAWKRGEIKPRKLGEPEKPERVVYGPALGKEKLREKTNAGIS